MTYSITVVAVNGELTSTSSGTVPDGKYQVSGHEDDKSLSASVVVQDTEGKTRLQASAWQPKEG